MKFLLRLVGENRATSAMLVFLLLFYALIFISNHPGKKEGHHAALKKAESVSRLDIQKREEIFKKKIQERPDLQKALSAIFVLLFLAGLVLNGYLLIKKFIQRKPWIQNDPLVPRLGGVPWGFREIFQAFVLLFFVEAAILLPEALAAAALGLEDPNHDFFTVLNSLIRDAVVLFWLIYLVRKKMGRPLADLGLTARKFAKNLFIGITGYVSILPALLICFLMLSFLMKVFSYEPPPQNVVQIYLKSSSDPYLFYFTVFVAVLGPVIEEIFFRGFAYQPVRRRFGAARAMLLTAAVFALFHMNMVLFLPIFLLGIFLAYLYEKTGSLVPSITAHVIHNLIMVGLTLGFKNLSS